MSVLTSLGLAKQGFQTYFDFENELNVTSSG